MKRIQTLSFFIVYIHSRLLSVSRLPLAAFFSSFVDMGKHPRICRSKNELKLESDPDDDAIMQDSIEDYSENEFYKPKCKKQKVSIFDQVMQKCTQVGHAQRAYWGPMDQKLIQKIDVYGACNIPDNDTTRDIKTYQIEGINFLWVLRKLGVGGAIIADDSGLGKTLQVIAFLAVLKHVQRNTGPHLVVAPVSLLQHWEQELARWCPSFNAVVYHGSKNEEFCDESRERKRTRFEILITSYSIFEGNSLQMKKDRKFLKKITWDCVIMDEGHCLKDATNFKRKELEGIAYSAKQRIMLTSAPIASEIQGLWSLLNLLIPDIFYDNISVQECFGAGRDRSQGEAMTMLLSFLKPFIICRAKYDVLDQLPPRTHHYNLRIST